MVECRVRTDFGYCREWAAFLFPVTSMPGVTEEVLIGLILLMSLLHTIAFAAATLGAFSILTWPRRLWFSVTLFGGVMLGL
jgi:hypothetical protein